MSTDDGWFPDRPICTHWSVKDPAFGPISIGDYARLQPNVMGHPRTNPGTAQVTANVQPLQVRHANGADVAHQLIGRSGGTDMANPHPTKHTAVRQSEHLFAAADIEDLTGQPSRLV